MLIIADKIIHHTDTCIISAYLKTKLKIKNNANVRFTRSQLGHLYPLTLNSKLFVTAPTDLAYTTMERAAKIYAVSNLSTRFKCYLKLISANSILNNPALMPPDHNGDFRGDGVV